ncbi:MAG TPA: hypothetical protein PK765_01700 [bacterium]|nr:hypothetical protein [bacterium]
MRYFSDPFCPAECAYSLDPALLEKLGCFHSTDLIDLLTIAGTGMATVIG